MKKLINKIIPIFGIVCFLNSCSRNYEANFFYNPKEVRTILVQEFPNKKKYSISPSSGNHKIILDPKTVSMLIFEVELLSGSKVYYKDSVILPERKVRVYFKHDRYELKVDNEAYF